MLVTFKTDVGNLSMFKDVALHMIKMMGHSATIPGAILAADVPSALNRLKSGINEEKISPPAVEDDNEDKDEDQDQDQDEDEPVVSIANRALPLIDLLTAAIEADCNVMWE
ncbi:DUF1840 domain-containing protein [Nitrosomonas aestuarii]|uniref:DUF1840 domain-containing protein n=1 Tax=Nitrosomonas aestuarii TaxID=52441 RepID=UPI000D327C6A|nr:DUF1840 domain-containing protein [Nitrosomonas aestuarii]PTN12280.1 uncharacterized protein DUF1840 [Nitrosomonas aestuarii]